MHQDMKQIVPVIDTTYTLILGRMLRCHIRSDLLRPTSAVDALGRVFEMKCPQ
jgi:hypothetical protein